MKMFYLLIAIMVLNFLSLHSQSYEMYKLDSKSSEVLFSQPTKIGSKYLIAIEGKYNQWSQSTNKGFGVDAVWYNDIPSFGNPALDTYIESLLKDPIWLGDEKTFTIPSIEPIMQGFKFGLKQYTGFRLNGEPLDAFPVDAITHRYQVEKVGTGAPFYFQILDSVYNLVNERTEARYDDNVGSLMVTIEEIKDTSAVICGLEVIDLGNNQVQIVLSAKMVVKDSTSTSGEKNILYEISQIGIIENGAFICPDSLVCGMSSKLATAWGLVIDRSASMEEPISQTDLFTTRMDAMKTALQEMISKMNTAEQIKDSSFVISFSNSVRLEQDWTHDKDSLIAAIESIVPDSATAFYTALIQGLEKLSKHKHPRKALIALTDGDNTRGPIWSQECLQAISQKYSDIQIYLIGLSFSNTQREKLALDTMKQIISKVKKGNVFQINQKDSLNLIYNEIAQDLTDDDCCSIYFKSKGCNGNDDTIKYKIVFVSGDELITKEISYKCKSDSTTGIIEIPFDKKDNILLKPNPAEGYTKLEFETLLNEEVEIRIIDIMGNTYYNYKSYLEQGTHTRVINTNDIPIGAYIVMISSNNYINYQKLNIVR